MYIKSRQCDERMCCRQAECANEQACGNPDQGKPFYAHFGLEEKNYREELFQVRERGEMSWDREGGGWRMK
jgi:hypothetical protein